MENLKRLIIIFFAILSVPILKAMWGAPFVPTPRKTSEKMLKEAGVKKNAVLYDLGCGDGRFIRLASRKYGAKAIGIELNPLIYLYAKIRSLGRKNETILFQDFCKINFSDADVIVCYLLGKTMAKIETKLQKELKKGTIIVSHGFKFKNWQLSKKIPMQNNGSGSIFIYKKI